LAVNEKVIGTYGLLTFEGPFDDVARSRHQRLFETEAMTWAVEFKWQAYGSYIHNTLFGVFILGLLLFWLAQVAAIVGRFDFRVFVEGQIHLSWSSDRGDAHSSFADGAMVASMIPIGVLVTTEVLQMWMCAQRAPKEGEGPVMHRISQSYRVVQYFSSVWNWTELATYGMMLAGARRFYTSAERELDVTTAALCGIADVMATVTFCGFMRTSSRGGVLWILLGLDGAGKTIRMLGGIFRDIIPFLWVQLIFILGFTMAFAMLLPDQPRFQLPMALLTSYDMMLGTWDLEQFEGSHDDRDGWVLTAVAVIMFVLYSLGVLVVAMNLLIAQVSATYEKARNDDHVKLRFERAEALAGMAWVFQIYLRLFPERWQRARGEWFPECLRVLAATKERKEDTIKTLGADIKKVGTATNAEIQKTNAEMQKTNAEIQKTNAEMQQLNIKLDKILAKL
jgi:hypothetical protein